MPYLDDIAAELRAIESWETRSQRANAAASSFSPAQAANMALAARMWPGLSPGALLALGHGNYRADHPLAMQLAELSERDRMRSHPYGAQYGQRSITRGMAADAARLEAQGASARRQAEWEAQRAAMTPAQRRLTDMEPRGRGNDLIDQAKMQGILRGDGTVVRPSAPRYRDGDWVYDDASAERTDKLFMQVMEALAEQNDGQPVPFLYGAKTSEEGETGIFHPATGRAEVLRPSDTATVDVPGPIDDWLERSKANVADLLSTRRFPDPFGAQQSAPIGPTSTAGFTTPKDLARAGFMTLDAPLQELQGQVRNLYALTHGEMPDFWETQSDLGIQLSTGGDAGTGFFVDQESEVAAERRRREAERGMIGDSRVTLGRWLVDGLTPFDPDTKPAMIMSGIADAAVAIKGDPSAFFLGKSGEAIRARRVFAAPGQTVEESAGVVNGLRKIVRPVDGSKFLDADMADPDGVLRTWADTGSAYDIWRMSNRKLPIRMAADIADNAHTPEEVRAIVEPAIGSRIRQVETFGNELRSAAHPFGAAQRPNVMPTRGRIDAHQHDLVAREVEAFLHNVPTATDDDIGEILTGIGRADNPIALNRSIKNALSKTDGLLAKAGIEDDNLRKRLTQLHEETHEEIQSTFIEAITHQGPTDNPMMLAGEEMYYPGAQLVTELAPQYITLPDARVIRRLSSQYANIFGVNAVATAEGKLRAPLAGLEWLQNEMWKPLQLMRMAWTVRVIGEEQIRMAAAGYDSMFKHPISFIASRLAHEGKAPDWMREGAEKGTASLKGVVMGETESFKSAMSGRNGAWVDRAIVPTGRPTRYAVTDIGSARDKFNRAWGSEVIRLHMDPVANHLANSPTMDDAVEWFTRGAGNEWRGMLATARPGQFDDGINSARAYLETVQRRIDYVTSGNGDLLDAVRTGRLNGEDLMVGAQQNPELAARLEDLHDEFGPLKVRGEQEITTDADNRWRRGVDSIFSLLMTNRTNNLSRAMVYDQAYYRRVEELLPGADPTMREAIIDAARSAGASGRAIKRMRGIRSTGKLTLDEIDFLAHGFAVDETKELLYDLTRRGRFMDAARLVFPFGEAWSEVLTRWFGKNGLISSNPKTIRRFQQTIQAARGEDFGEVMTGEPGGFFTVNEFGEEVFTYPGSRLLTDKLLGVPVPLTGNVQGLSMFGTIMPGLGPVVQMPVAWALENKPGPQAVKELFGVLETTEIPVLEQTVKEAIVPFGSPASLDQGEALNVYNFLPAWMRTSLNAFFNEDVGATQTFLNSQLSMAAYLRSTGRYGNSRADQQRLMEDAADLARNFTIIKALVQTTAPASPSPDWLLEANGRHVRARALAEEYQALKDEDFASADMRFYERYGADVLAAVQPKTRAAVYGLPVTREGAQWVLNNPGIEDRLPNVYGFFAPPGDPDDFDYTLYSAQVQSGDRQILDLAAYNQLMVDTKADLLYQRAVEMAGDDTSREMTTWLREVRERIHAEYTGWQSEAGLFGRATTDEMIRELYDAAEDDVIRDTDAGRGLALYLEARDMAMEEAQSLDDGNRAGFQTSEDTADLRLWLTDVAGRIIDKYPEFKTVWDFVLSREVTGGSD